MLKQGMFQIGFTIFYFIALQVNLVDKIWRINLVDKICGDVLAYL